MKIGLALLKGMADGAVIVYLVFFTGGQALFFGPKIEVNSTALFAFGLVYTIITILFLCFEDKKTK